MSNLAKKPKTIFIKKAEEKNIGEGEKERERERKRGGNERGKAREGG
jgi:hypothetical protein